MVESPSRTIEVVDDERIEAGNGPGHDLGRHFAATRVDAADTLRPKAFLLLASIAVETAKSKCEREREVQHWTFSIVVARARFMGRAGDSRLPSSSSSHPTSRLPLGQRRTPQSRRLRRRSTEKSPEEAEKPSSELPQRSSKMASGGAYLPSLAHDTS